MDDSFEIVLGEATDSHAYLYVRATRTAKTIHRLTGLLTGPECQYGRTLPNRYALDSMAPTGGPLAELVVPEPCFWTPEMPLIYRLDMQLQDRAGETQTFSRLVGIRRWGVDRTAFRLDQRRTVLRGVDVGSRTPNMEQLGKAHKEQVTLIVRRPDATLGEAASRMGVALVADLRGMDSRAMVSRELFRVSRWPAVLMALVDVSQIDQEQPLPAGLIMLQPLGTSKGEIASWADAVMVETGPASSLPDWLAEVDKPILALRPSHQDESLATTRQACDRLQADLAPQFDLAGYFVSQRPLTQTNQLMTPPDPLPNPSLDRYRRQTRYRQFGEAGQCRLLASRVLVCGCGALGSVIAETLVRAGVGFVRVVDRDFLELDNLHRQVLYDEADVAAGLPKAAAAADHLGRINSQVEVVPVVEDISYQNIRRLADDVDLLLDGTDNFQTRYLLNDYAIATGKPWIYGGCIGAEGQTMTILPGTTPCLACVMPESPPASVIPTCETAGVLGPIVNVIASLQAIDAIKILSGHPEARNPGLTVIDLWQHQLRTVGLAALAESSDCAVCKQGDFAWLEGRRGDAAISLCGRNAVQISPTQSPTATAQPLQLDELARKLRSIGQVTSNPFLVRLTVEHYVISIFADGRAIVSGTDDISVARAVHARYIGA